MVPDTVTYDYAIIISSNALIEPSQDITWYWGAYCRTEIWPWSMGETHRLVQNNIYFCDASSWMATK